MSHSLMRTEDDDGETETSICAGNKRKKARRRCHILHEDTFFEIFLHLPAHVLHAVMKRVCKDWNSMISSTYFIRHHLQNSSLGIMLMRPKEGRGGIYFEMRGSCLGMHKFECNDLKLCGCSVNGLILGIIPWKGGMFHRDVVIANPVTNQQETIFHGSVPAGLMTLAFSKTSMQYKVVCSLNFRSRSSLVRTIGVDKDLRILDESHISVRGQHALLRASPLAIGGYVHWCFESVVVTLDVETEIFNEFSMPTGFHTRNVMAVGCNLCAYRLVRPPISSEFLMQVVWMNSDTGEWRELLNLDLKPLRTGIVGDLKSIKPCGVLGGGDVFLFRISTGQKLGFCATLNVRTREIQMFPVERLREHYSIVHLNSLTWYK